MIGILTAVQDEYESVKDKLSNSTHEKYAGMDFLTGKLNNKEVTLVHSGIGKVNAACASQLLIDKFNVDSIVNVGVGGALTDELGVGDIVIATDAIQYDMDARCFGNRLGEIPELGVISFPVSQDYIELAEEAANELKIRYEIGTLLTADLGLDDEDIKADIVEEFNGICCDMESAAVGQVCYLNNIPFFAIRSISDNANEDSGDSYEQNLKNSANASADLMFALIDKL